MQFNSISFFAFLVLVFAVYWRLKKHTKAQNVLIVVASYYFYASWDWRFLILIFISSVTDFFAGKKIEAASTSFSRKSWLTVSLLVNLGMLAYFKYFNFFIESANVALSAIGLETSISSLSIILPVGISFYTFQTLSYTIDIYRKQLKPTSDTVQFFAFVSFFPQLVAGPIERASNLLPQFSTKRVFDAEQATTGLRLILWGLFKKMVIADRVAELVDIIFSAPGQANATVSVLGGFLFAYQVYCDFSGYSDIAIGAARLFGFSLMRNFMTPFHAVSMTELWQRWHISLSTWFRDYLYIPLGGSRASTIRWAFNILATFTISGLWHGADFHYVLWGFLCGLPLIAERLLQLKKLGVVYAFGLFSILLITFRADSVNSALLMYGKVLELDFGGLDFIYQHAKNEQGVFYTLALLGVFVLAEAGLRKKDFDLALSQFKAPTRWLVYYSLLFTIMMFGVMDNAPRFIYFQF